MSWTTRISDSEGSFQGAWQACEKCKHFQMPPAGNFPCYIPKVAGSIGSLLTAVDTGKDNYMASGIALLKCNGFDPVITS